jgi:predicted nucleic acid-binding protein
VIAVDSNILVYAHRAVFPRHRAAVERLLASPSIRVLKPESRFADGFVELSRAAGETGNLAFDAQIAAVSLEHGVTEILTSDRDFERFEGLKPRYLDPPESS